MCHECLMLEHPCPDCDLEGSYYEADLVDLFVNIIETSRETSDVSC